MERVPTITREVYVGLENGLHLGPLSQIVQTASRFQCQIEICKGDKTVDGKSMLDLLTLAAERGTRLTLCARGEDAAQALEALVALFEKSFQADATA